MYEVRFCFTGEWRKGKVSTNCKTAEICAHPTRKRNRSGCFAVAAAFALPAIVRRSAMIIKSGLLKVQ